MAYETFPGVGIRTSAFIKGDPGDPGSTGLMGETGDNFIGPATPYVVPDIEDVYDNIKNTSGQKNGVSFYVCEVLIKSGYFMQVSVTVFCRLLYQDKPVENQVFYTLDIPTGVVRDFEGYNNDALKVDEAGNIEYTAPYSDTPGMTQQFTYFYHMQPDA